MDDRFFNGLYEIARLEDAWFCRMRSGKLVKSSDVLAVGRIAAINFARASSISSFPLRTYQAGWQIGQMRGVADEAKREESMRYARGALKGFHGDPGLEGKWGGLYEEETKTMFRTVFAAQVVATWTAFEQLAGSLWERALNVHPHGLAKLSGLNEAGEVERARQEEQRIKRAEKEAKEGKAVQPEMAKAEKGKMIPLSFLEQHDYNVSTMMGTIWQREREFNFQILSQIREAYVRAFYEDHAKVRAAIRDDSLTALAAARNVIVHKAGIIDPKFLEDAGDLAIFNGVELERPLMIDGPMLKDLVVPAIETSYKLIRAVSDWLIAHAEKPNGTKQG